MVKKFLGKVMAVMLGIIIISTSTINANAAETDINKSVATGELQLLNTYDGTILPHGMSYTKYYFTMDMPTGSGSGEIVLNQSYYDSENLQAHKAAITAGMGTNVTCDMGVTITAQDSWYDWITLDKDAYQTTSFYAKKTGNSSAYVMTSCKIWCCDDVDRGTITYGATESN